MTELLDARGVPIAPGDTAIYGFGVSRSVAMAEAVVLGVERPPGEGYSAPVEVSLTPSGRVRLRVVRRSYSSGQKPVVDVAPDRLVVLKEVRVPLHDGMVSRGTMLPLSPLPTQDEEARAGVLADIAKYNEGILTGISPDWWEAAWEPYAQFCAAELKKAQRKLRALDE